ncbi:MAG: hypothetical protein ABJG41_14710 [Cyclobacteriaceae bacterium]
MNIKPFALALGVAITIISCNSSSTKEVTQESEQTEPKVSFQNKGHELVYKMIEKVGDYEKLKSKKDVTYTYTYITPDGSTDKSTEKYLFEGELSYGNYSQHERTIPHIEGPIEQGYDGNEFWIKSNGELVNDSTALKKVMFNRPTNFYWFTMFQKLADPGLKYDYLGETIIDNKNFDIVKVSFELNDDKPTDIYQLYINKETGIVDQFLFTVAEYGVVETPLLMQLEYEEVDGFLLPTKRKYKKSNWEAEVMDTPWVLVNWSNIRFHNNFTKEEFSK